jgi:hypothetical protein
MTTPFGPRLVGETEKALGALLDRFLAGTGLTERHWVTLQVARQLAGVPEAPDLATTLARRAAFDGAQPIADLTERGLLDQDRPTAAGEQLAVLVQRRIDDGTTDIWANLGADDVDATTRVLNEVASRARAVFAELERQSRTMTEGA